MTDAGSQEVLAGLVERVTYHNPENGFCVLRAKARGHRDLVDPIARYTRCGCENIAVAQTFGWLRAAVRITAMSVPPWLWHLFRFRWRRRWCRGRLRHSG